ncbi:MAG: L,D-transpeptidase [Candidatus Dormibacteria bacterium]
MAVVAAPSPAVEESESPSGEAAAPQVAQSGSRVRLRMLLVAVIVSAITSGIGVQLVKGERVASAGYDQGRAQVLAAVSAAQAQGYSPDDLSGITAALEADRARNAPFFPSRQSFYEQQRASVLSLLSQISVAEAGALARRKSAAQAGLSDTAAAIETARGQGADPEQIDPLKAKLDQLSPALTAAKSPKEIETLAAQAAQLVQAASTAGAAATAEQARLAQAAEALKGQFAGNLDQIRAAGNAAVAPARNDATVATMLKIGGIGSLVARVEHYASLLPGADLNQVALGAAGVQSYQRQVHDLLIAKLPSQTITLSLGAQELWAYQDGKVVQDTLITSGRPALPTDVGAMKVLSRQSPWKMHSPWPRWSPYWYPDTYVNKVVWFTVTGEGLHDASWEPASLYGPGGQFTSSASHGCVHVQMAAENFLFDWAQIGTPVIVFPGDGSPVAEQMKQVSVDEHGVPFTGPKGA